MHLELDALGADGEVAVSWSSRQRATSEGWCGTPPRSVSMGAAVAGGASNGLLQAKREKFSQREGANRKKKEERLFRLYYQPPLLAPRTYACQSAKSASTELLLYLVQL